MVAFLIQIWLAQNLQFTNCRRFFLYRRHGNIDFTKISIITNFNSKRITGVNFTSLSKDYIIIGGKSELLFIELVPPCWLHSKQIIKVESYSWKLSSVNQMLTVFVFSKRKFLRPAAVSLAINYHYGIANHTEPLATFSQYCSSSRKLLIV